MRGFAPADRPTSDDSVRLRNPRIEKANPPAPWEVERVARPPRSVRFVSDLGRKEPCWRWPGSAVKR